jgi:hypothetical protein
MSFYQSAKNWENIQEPLKLTAQQKFGIPLEDKSALW